MKTRKTADEVRVRKAKQKATERALRKRSGLVRVDAWVLPSSVAEVHRLAERDREIVRECNVRSLESGVE